MDRVFEKVKSALKTGHNEAGAENHHAHGTSSYAWKTIEHTVSASMLNSCRTNSTVQDFFDISHLHQRRK